MQAKGAATFNSSVQQRAGHRRYDDYTVLLKRIERRFKSSKIFISGSSVDYTPFGDVEGPRLINELARSLILAGAGIVSGFGSGVGPLVVNGALEAAEKEGSHDLHDRLTLRPFPIAIADATVRRRRWKAYRRDMLAGAGVAIFLFGDKLEGGTKVIADGVLEEFEIAHELGLAVVPVAATGAASRVLHERVLSDFSEYYPRTGYRQLFQALAKPGSVVQIVERTLELVGKLQSDHRPTN